MFTIGQFVQPRQGGPKLKIVDIQGEELVCVRAAAPEQGKIIYKASEVTRYSEEGDFGVC